MTPTTGAYTIAGIFEKLNGAGNGEDVHVLRNGLAIYDQVLTAPDTENDVTGAFNLPSVSLVAGDKVDFVVGPNGNGDFGSDSVGFRASLTLVPEPASLVILALGAVGISAAVRRRKA